jgi:hypothetical protein
MKKSIKLTIMIVILLLIIIITGFLFKNMYAESFTDPPSTSTSTPYPPVPYNITPSPDEYNRLLIEARINGSSADIINQNFLDNENKMITDLKNMDEKLSNISFKIINTNLVGNSYTKLAPARIGPNDPSGLIRPKQKYSYSSDFLN